MTVTTKQQVISLLEQNQAELRRLGVSRCGLFGSFRTEQTTDKSDVDILVVFQPGMKTFNNFMDLCFFLEDLFFLSPLSFFAIVPPCRPMAKCSAAGRR